jgi:hypothetical protein
MGYDLYGVGNGNTGFDKDYFYLNMWSMSVVVELLTRLGVLDRDMPTPPSPLEVWLAPPADMAESDPRGVEFRRRYRAATGLQSKRPGKVPAFKLNSNDQWHVTPGECAVLAEALRRCDGATLAAGSASAPRTPLVKFAALFPDARFGSQDKSTPEWAETVRAFAAFCERSAATGGFIVS